MMEKMELATQAQEMVEGWARGAQALALLHTAVRSGLLSRLDVARAPEELGGDAPLIDEVCRTLALAGVLHAQDGRYQLSPAFQAALDPAMMLPLRGVLEGLQARVEALQESQGYEGSATSIAEGATLNPLSPITEAVIGEWMKTHAPSCSGGSATASSAAASGEDCCSCCASNRA